MKNVPDEDSSISYLWFVSEQILISINAFVTQKFSSRHFSDGVNKTGFLTA